MSYRAFYLVAASYRLLRSSGVLQSDDFPTLASRVRSEKSDTYLLVAEEAPRLTCVRGGEGALCGYSLDMEVSETWAGFLKIQCFYLKHPTKEALGQEGVFSETPTCHRRFKRVFRRQTEGITLREQTWKYNR